MLKAIVFGMVLAFALIVVISGIKSDMKKDSEFVEGLITGASMALSLIFLWPF